MISWNLFQGWKDDLTSTNHSMLHTILTKWKINIIWWFQQTQRGKSQHSFVIKTLNKVGIKGMFLNIRKAMYDKPTVNPVLHGEKLEAIPLTSGTK